MTRILLTIAIIFSFSMLASAQFKKGDVLLGGDLYYGYNASTNFYTYNTPQTTDQRNNNGNFSISVGKALNETTVTGIDLSYSPSTSTNFNGNYYPVKSKTNYYGAGVFYRKYKNLGKEFFIFGQVNASYNWSNQSGKDTLGAKVLSGSSWGIGANAYPGIAYRISKHFFMELTMPSLILVNYNKSNYSLQDGQTPPAIQKTNYENFGISTSLSSGFLSSVAVGFQVLL